MFHLDVLGVRTLISYQYLLYSQFRFFELHVKYVNYTTLYYLLTCIRSYLLLQGSSNITFNTDSTIAEDAIASTAKVM